MNCAIVIVAAVLALLAGAYQVWFAIQLPDHASTYSYATKGLEHYTMSLDHFVAWLRAEAALSAAAALALILGGWMMLTRTPVGRIFVIVGCLVVIVHTGVGWVVATKLLPWFTEMGATEEGFRWFNTPSKHAIVLLSLAVPVITGLVVLLPGARRQVGHAETSKADR